MVEANSAAAAMHGYAREAFIGLPSTAYLHPDSHHLFSESAQTVQAGGVFEAPMLHVRRDGSPFHVEVRRTAFSYQGRLCLLRAYPNNPAARKAISPQAKCRKAA